MSGPGRIAFRLSHDPDSHLSSLTDLEPYLNQEIHGLVDFTASLADTHSTPIHYNRRTACPRGHTYPNRTPNTFALAVAGSAGGSAAGAPITRGNAEIRST
jgi:hypothetical protein